MHFLRASALLLVFILASFGGGYLQFPQSGIDPKELKEIEEISEAVASGLHGLSIAVRRRDAHLIAGYFTEPAGLTPLPAGSSRLAAEAGGVCRHGWEFEPGSIRVMSHTAIGREWRGFLAHFSSIGDVRFELAEFAADSDAKVIFSLVGRDVRGRREWLRGAARASFECDAAGIRRINSLVLGDLDSLVAARDIFSEIGESAGVATAIPAYGEKGNTGSIWRGAAAADFNNDGRMDIFATAADGNYLYLNLGGRRFRDASETVGVRSLASGTGVIAVDFDNDGDSDMFVANVGSQILLENRLIPDGQIVFRDISLESGVGAAAAVGFSAAAADVNGDGLPDIYVASYNHYGRVMPDSWVRSANGTPNLLFINRGQGKFTEEAVGWGVDDARWSYAAGFADVDGDGRQDLMVANDFGEKGLFINKGARFVDEAAARGVLDPGFGMGVSFGDFNNDGRLDLFTTNMSSIVGDRILARLFPQERAPDNIFRKLAAGNSLFVNLGGGMFRDVSAEVGGFPGGWAWGGGFIDFDNDGWEDVYTPNGYISGKVMNDTSSHYWQQVLTQDSEAKIREDEGGISAVQIRLMDAKGFSFSGYERDSLFLSAGGRRFIDISGVSGIDSISDGRAAVFVDIDDDGDLDVFLTTIQGRAHLLFHNLAGQQNRHLRVVLEGTKSGRDAFGAEVRVKTSFGIMTKIKAGGSGFLSQHDPRLLFGLGRETGAEWVEVLWPSGIRQRFGNVPAGTTMHITEGMKPRNTRK